MKMLCPKNEIQNIIAKKEIRDKIKVMWYERKGRDKKKRVIKNIETLFFIYLILLKKS